MARGFDDASIENLSVESAVVSTTPLTMSAWCYTDDLTADQTLLTVTAKGGTNRWHTLSIRGDVGGDPISADSRVGGSTIAYSTTGVSANTWHHACGIFRSSADRSAYIDGGSRENDTNDVDPTGMDRTAIGANRDSSPNQYMSGNIAEAAIWNAALTDAEVASLAAGYSPLLIRPANLVFYVPLIRDNDEDIVGGLSLTANGTPTVETHPRIIYPVPQLWVPAPAAADGDPSPNVSDDATATDSVTVDVSDPQASATDNAEATDTATANIQIDATAQDDATATDSATVSIAAVATLAIDNQDDATATDSVTADVSDPQITAQDDATATDSVTVSISAIGTIEVNITDDATATDSVTVVLPIGLSVQDDATATDSTVMLLEALVSVQDDATATDFATVTTEAPTAELSVNISPSANYVQVVTP